MQVALFLKNKIARQIAINGRQFTFARFGLDEYHQRLETSEVIATIKGVFHETTSYIKSADSDTGRMVSKPQPMILTLCDNNSRLLEKDDEVVIGSNTYRLIAKRDVENLGVAYDISLEVKA